jgi:hypothetical protein
VRVLSRKVEFYARDKSNFWDNFWTVIGALQNCNVVEDGRDETVCEDTS